MSKTIERLNESHFFLKKLNEKYLNQSESVYFFNAFITSSRSVLWIMRSEYGKIKGWKAWYELKQPKKEEKALLKKITDLRNRSQKKGPITPDIQMTIQMENVSPEMKRRFKKWMGKRVSFKLRPRKSKADDKPKVTEKSIEGIVKLKEIKAVVPEFPEDDISSVCKKYYSLLESLVSECEKKFKKVK